jgi:hypothetical protein
VLGDTAVAVHPEVGTLIAQISFSLLYALALLYGDLDSWGVFFYLYPTEVERKAVYVSLWDNSPGG